MALLFCLATQPALAIDKKALRRALSGTDRGVSDYIRDEIRKQVEVLDFLGIEACMHVLDVYAADGYYTFILSKAVGPEGIVYAQNTPRGLRFEEDRMEKQGAIDTALAAGFLITSDSDLLHNPADSHKRSIFDPMLNRNTDRFLLKLQKPE